ncbi:helix-turn-helix transcriptional regulator [Anaerotignum propionicum]|jgi:predicted transcriptional regulator YheO|uniref:Predicted transcriptional regulator YheO, contains PAS and DNA-binding HTH domains n=1 Tax=Anaerotignum propionicum DSM 1682 TaxID=991789 RepID=A0A110A764_ANAPI|nr:PAS domain-containing protein [Anaerotignum propionicum]AMJ41613.1 YheO-like PAS domain protein [Anaerotignum propionicum DSM 1682]MEA5057302.1 PAS domain-containing protein [Anaerotignum propionicum]SHE87322.1 Predicted transcriptional regulator YheO, contains PAS and DNA-binding HTH domains [[Clostridium] propionicum DSM 1682] [Anaerotignum propionicum DSM 1682]
MESQSFSLSDHDRAILYSYVNVAEGVAEFLGNFCEVVIHNLENMDHSVMHIINGHLSGRQVGASISEVTLSFLNRMMAEPNLNHLYYFAKNKRGETFKSSISAIMGEKENIIGLLCINMYLSSPISDLVHFMTPSESTKQENISETFVENTVELMLHALEEAKKAVYSNLSISSSNKNKEIVSTLYQKGIFNLKDSVVTIADHLGISKNTVYMHIRNMNK